MRRIGMLMVFLLCVTPVLGHARGGKGGAKGALSAKSGGGAKGAPSAPGAGSGGQGLGVSRAAIYRSLSAARLASVPGVTVPPGYGAVPGATLYGAPPAVNPMSSVPSSPGALSSGTPAETTEASLLSNPFVNPWSNPFPNPWANPWGVNPYVNPVVLGTPPTTPLPSILHSVDVYNTTPVLKTPSPAGISLFLGGQ